MTSASICTIGDEILIGQIVDTNSSYISKALNAVGIRVKHMVSIGDDRKQIIDSLSQELRDYDIVIVTGGLGPTKDDITKDALAELSGSKVYVQHAGQEKIVRDILSSRGLDILDINIKQASVPETCKVIENRLGTAPIMAFHFDKSRFGHKAALYSMPGVPHETIGALQDVMNDIKQNFSTSDIFHKTVMTYGIAESALSEMISDWEDNLPADMHLAYLPNPLTGVRLRLSIYGGEKSVQEARINERYAALKEILGDNMYSEDETSLQEAIGTLLRGSGITISTAESCTGGKISSLITSVAGSSEYYLGSVISYAISVKENVLGVPAETIEKKGVVSEAVAAAMAQGVRRVTGSTLAVSTTGLAGPGGDERNPEGTVCIAVDGPLGTQTRTCQYHNDRKRNIERFAATALDMLRRYIILLVG